MRFKVPSGETVDGKFWLSYNDDKTQAILIVAPPQGDGNPVRVGDVVQALEEMGVAYGIDEQAIREAIERATNIANKVQAIAAQGVLPVHGTDARVNYRLPEEAILRSLPLLPDGSVDYLQLSSERYIQQGQLIATIVPAQHGRPGRTLTFPPQQVRQRPGRDASLRAGENVIASDDNLQFTSERSGYVYLSGDRLCVLPALTVQNDIASTQSFDVSLVLSGNLLSSAQVKVHGDATIGGRCEGAFLQARGTCYLRQGSERSHIAADGNLLLGGNAIECTLSSRKRVLALCDDVQIVGGRVEAFDGIEAGVVGTANWTPTELVAGVDTIGDERLFEIAEEIRQCEANIQKIENALAPFLSITSDSATAERKRTIQLLMAQRRRLEACLKELQHEKREITIQVNAPVRAEIIVRGVVYPGVKVAIGKHNFIVETEMKRVRFFVARGEARIQVRPLSS